MLHVWSMKLKLNLIGETLNQKYKGTEGYRKNHTEKNRYQQKYPWEKRRWPIFVHLRLHFLQCLIVSFRKKIWPDLNANGHETDYTVVGNNCYKQSLNNIFTALQKGQHFVLKQANIYYQNSKTNKQAVSASCTAERAGLHIFRTAPTQSGRWQCRGSVARQPPAESQ